MGGKERRVSQNVSMRQERFELEWCSNSMMVMVGSKVVKEKDLDKSDVGRLNFLGAGPHLRGELYK